MSVDTIPRLWDLTDNAWCRQFSNFRKYPFEMFFDGELFLVSTGEHAYQCLKTIIPKQRQKVLSQPTAATAKKCGRSVTLRPRWVTEKIKVMQAVILHRVANDRQLKNRLLHTGQSPIIEVNTWGDRVWGTDTIGFGANQLGQIFMELRGWL